MEFHPVSNLFPLMVGDEFDALVADIKAHGQIEPILLYQGMVLDGRNRWRACEVLGTEPITEDWEGDDPIGFVISLNLHRRHLNESQRALVAAKLANMQSGYRTDLEPTANLQEVPISRADAAELLNVSERSVNSAAKVLQQALPETVAAVEQGVLPVSVAASLTKQTEEFQAKVVEKVVEEKVTPTTAIRETKREEIQAHLEDVAVQEVKATNGVYDVIVIDPPWPIEKIERDVTPNQVLFEYPTMTLKDIDALELPMADDCHVWLWTTHKYLPRAFEVLKSWGLKYVCTFVWHKNGGFQPFELPQYNCEFALYARKGTPKFIDLSAFPTCFSAKRGAHSEKPQAFYDIVARVTAGRRLDMFNRRTIPGFDVWGNEASD